MRVIFLDFDGVLNSLQFVNYYRRYNGRYPDIQKQFCKVACANLQLLLDEIPDAKIVVSSRWRIRKDPQDLKSLLHSMAGVDPARVIDRTTNFGGRPRGHEIADWLEKHSEVKSFVILDDDSDMDPVMDYLIQTSALNGLTMKDAQMARDILRNIVWDPRKLEE